MDRQSLYPSQGNPCFYAEQIEEYPNRNENLIQNLTFKQRQLHAAAFISRQVLSRNAGSLTTKKV